MKKYKKYTKIFTSAILLLILCASNCFAQTLAEFEKQIAQYQKNPLARANQLLKEGYENVKYEESVTRQLDFPISYMLDHESTIASSVNYYMSLYTFIKEDATSDTTVIDDDTLAELVQQKPPYTLVYYINVLDNDSKCNTVVAEREEYIKKYKKGIAECQRRKTALEEKYRLYNDQLSGNSSSNVIGINNKLEYAKAKLEQCMVEEYFYRVAMQSRQRSINDLRAKKEVLDKLLIKIRPHVIFSSDDSHYLDIKVDKEINKLLATAKQLHETYDDITEYQRTNEKPTAFTKYCDATEQNLIEGELHVLTDVAEEWVTLRAGRYLLGDILTKKITKEEDINAHLQKLTTAIQMAKEDEQYCINQLSIINSAQRGADALFGAESITLTASDRNLRDYFYKLIDGHRTRINSYLFTLMKIEENCQNILNECNSIANNNGKTSEQRLHDFIYKLIDLRDFELWHVGEYPITLGRLLLALFILFIGNFVALSINFVIRHRMIKRNTGNQHNVLLITTFIKYFMLLIAFLIALSSLKIPFTAFAFAGGAVAVAFGFGAQAMMADIFCGITLLLKNRIRVGDHIILNGQYGIVKEITLHDTIISTEESKDMVITNSQFFSNEFVNLTLSGTVVRTSVEVGVAYSTNMKEAERVIYQTLDKSRYVVHNKYRVVLLNKFDNSSLNILVRFFMDLENNLQSEVQGYVRSEILEAFRQNNIEIAFPQLDVHFDKPVKDADSVSDKNSAAGNADFQKK